MKLIVVVVEAYYVAAGKFYHLSGWTADSTPDVKDIGVLFEADLEGEVVFVAGDSLVETLTWGESAEVEGCAPAILVEICG